MSVMGRETYWPPGNLRAVGQWKEEGVKGLRGKLKGPGSASAKMLGHL